MNYQDQTEQMSLIKRNNFKKKKENRVIRYKGKYKINTNKKYRRIKKNLWDL